MKDIKLNDMMQQKKFIILLKAAYYALKTFKRKENWCMNEIKVAVESVIQM